MIYLFHHTFPCSELLRVNDLTNEYIHSLTSNTEVNFDSTFDSMSAIDVASLDASDKLKRHLASHGIDAKLAITRSFPHPSFEWLLAIEIEQRIGGIDSFVARFFHFSRMERNEILSYNEIVKTINTLKI